MQIHDVIIVGGGPAGSSCAWKLRAAGADVVVLDKADFPRDKVCAGWVTPAVLATLRIDPADYGRGRVIQPIAAFRAGRIGGPSLRIDYPGPVSYGIRRCEFDHYLLERCGARLALGQPARTVRREAGQWVVNDEFRAPMLVAAGGHFCPVARMLGEDMGRDAPAPVAAQEIEFPMDARQQSECRVDPETPEVYFCEDLSGYGWCFRKGDYLNVGLGREDRQGLAGHVEAFCEWLKAEGRIPRDLPGRMHGHAYYLHERSPRKLVGEGVLAVGDAAGLAYAQSGEGIRPAVESGLMAAAVILAAGGDGSPERLAPYAEAVFERFGRRRAGGGPMRLVPVPLRRWLARRLLGSPWFVRRVVLDKWFLRAGQSPLDADELAPAETVWGP